MADMSYFSYVHPCFLKMNRSTQILDVAHPMVPKRICDGENHIYRYHKLNEISHGSYGVVYKAWDKKKGEIVAVKRETRGMSKETVREIRILESLPQNPSIVALKQVAVDGRGGIFVVMEYCEHDLKRLMDATKGRPWTMSQVKGVMKQLLEGVKFLHDHKVMHRDLKPSNLLINNKAKLKICDFGLSREFESREGHVYSPHVVTLWYRAPELLLGAINYTRAIDMWSVGCIMAELVLREVLFKGCSEIQQLFLIYSLLGTPNDIIWPGFSRLPGGRVNCSQVQPYNLLRNKLVAVAAHTGGGGLMLSDLGFDLLQRLLIYDPRKRITAEEALNHGWFNEIIPNSQV